MFVIWRETESSKLSSSTLFKVEYRSDTAEEQKKERFISGSTDIHGAIGTSTKTPPRELPIKAEELPAVPGVETSVLPLDSFVCRYVAPLLQCYSPSLRQCVLLKKRAVKPAAVVVTSCSRTVLDVCFAFQKFCEV